MEFVGNKKNAELFARMTAEGVFNHAYLLSGPQYLGKFTLAKMFALNAISGKKMTTTIDEPNKDALMDLIIVEPETVEKKGIRKQRDISIEQIREAKQSLSLFPYNGKYKVLIINDAHRLNVAAQNALLKILEEPNNTTIIILVTHEFERILSTVISRVQMMNFSLVGPEEMQNVSSDQQIAKLAAGRPGLAILLENDREEKEMRLEASRELEKISNGSLGEKFSLAEEYSKNNVNTLIKLNVWIWQLRQSALENSQRYLENYGKIEKIQNCLEKLKRTNANSKLLLETLFMDL